MLDQVDRDALLDRRMAVGGPAEPGRPRRNARQFAATDDAEIEGPIHRVSPRIGGAVEAVLVHQNQHVEQGQLLVRLDPKPAQVALRQAEMTQAEAGIEVASASPVEIRILPPLRIGAYLPRLPQFPSLPRFPSLPH